MRKICLSVEDERGLSQGGRFLRLGLSLGRQKEQAERSDELERGKGASRPASSTHGKPIYWVGGSKGGVGKSLVTMATLDTSGETLLLIECDTSNPDVWKGVQGRSRVRAHQPRRCRWVVHLVNVCETTGIIP